MKPKALVITGNGTNCEREMAHACELAGCEATITHVAAVFGRSGMALYRRPLAPNRNRAAPWLNFRREVAHLRSRIAPAACTAGSRMAG